MEFHFFGIYFGKVFFMLKKLLTCLLAGLVCGFCFFRIGRRFLIDWLPFPVILFIAAGILLTAIVFGVYWAFRRERSPRRSAAGQASAGQTAAERSVAGRSVAGQSSMGRSAAIMAFWQGAIRYGIAMDLSMIGFQKLFHLQFSTHLGALDLPFNSFSPEDLTWAFFGQSRTFVCIIGGIQILGSFLLLFSRTKLAGVFVLLPVVLNIVLLNACYHMEWGESVQALELLLALLYLLFSEYGRLVEFFFRARRGLAAIRLKSRLLSSGIRLSTLFVPLLLIWHYGPPDKNPWLTGKYMVSHLRINQRDMVVHSCADSLLSTVYFDPGNECLFEYNSQQRRVYGIYRLDAGKTRMTVIWHYPKNVTDTLVATLSAAGSGRTWTLSGRMGKDSVQMELLEMR
jgi:hypothetical protein